MAKAAGSWLSWGAVALLTTAAASAWTPTAVHDDPLLRLPGSQPADGVVVEPPNRCLNCHDNYDPAVDVGFFWKGGMMAQASRDPLYWATLVVAAQDSIWALGNPNATDLCLRCHSPAGWLAGRSDPTSGSALSGADFDGVSCDFCHRMVDPFFETTYAGTREGDDWQGYWDETNASGTPSSAAASATLQADRSETAVWKLFNGTPAVDSTSWLPVFGSTWTDNGGGQFFVSVATTKRASFADATARHGMAYSRYHKSKYYCATCHDVSNPALANLTYAGTLPGDGSTVLPSEQEEAASYFHVERTFSEFLLSAYGQPGGSVGTGTFAPSVFTTSRPGNAIATCQDCHMPDRLGHAAKLNDAVLRPDGSLEHPQSGQPLHDLTGGNAWVPWLLASSVPGSPNYDALNASLLTQGPLSLTMDLGQGEPLNPQALLHASERAIKNLAAAASVEGLSYDSASGQVRFRIVNHTGHKLISGYPEGRRVFVNVRAYLAGAVLYEVNPYDYALGTLADETTDREHVDELIYEARLSSSLTGEEHTFHFVLADGRYKDNRIPPKGFRIAEAPARLVEPVVDGVLRPDLFSAAEYAGGYDDVELVIPSGADGIQVRLFYQTTSREYVEALREEIAGNGELVSPSPSGEAQAYVVQSDPFFSQLAAWGETIWQLWEHNKDVPGAAPVLMAEASTGIVGDPCAEPGSDGQACSDGSACTSVDSCAAGVCVGAAPLTCLPLDECHLAGSCDPQTGTCSDPPQPDGVACSAGVCQGGVCVPPGSGGSGGAGGVGGVGGLGGSGGLGGVGGLAGAGGTAGGAGTAASGGAVASGGTGGVAGSGGGAGPGGTAGVGQAGSAAGTTGSGGGAGVAPSPAQVDSADDAGCGCRMAGRRGSGSSLALGFGVLAVLLRRRRSR